MIIYLVGPITGKGYGECVAAIKSKAYTLKKCGYQILSPLAGKAQLRNETEFKPEMYDHPVSQAKAVFRRDYWMVSECDIVLADFTDSTIASIGSCFELAWAYMQGKQVISVIPEKNVHRHAFVLQASTIVFDNMEDAMDYLIDFSDEVL